ncbi:MAG: hypothetical protein E6I91_06945 [Chloroflexi bacterium]|nr:MAG: hypothetical protein E6I91_06945 [Chloroflexota bacterium]
MTSTVRLRTIVWGAILTLLWICSFLFIKSTLAVDFGGGILINLKFLVALLGLLIIVLYHIFDRPSAETTKLSLTTALTIVWLALITFYPFIDPNNKEYSGAVAFFTLIGGLAVSVFWVRFFADEII